MTEVHVIMNALHQKEPPPPFREVERHRVHTSGQRPLGRTFHRFMSSLQDV
jgi:hypothetical protein